MSDELDDDDREVLARLRALPHDGTEPSWDRFARDLDRKLAAPPPAPWWRRWWAPALGASLAAATAAVVLMWPQGAKPPAEPVAVIDHDAAPAPAPAPPGPEPVRPAVLAFGAEGELDDADLDDVDVVAGVMAALEEAGVEDADEGDDLAVLDDVPDEPAEGLVPDLDLDWVDELDDADLDAVTAWLDEEEPS